MTTEASRSDVQTVPCPRCDADPGQPCWGVRGKPRESCHRERHDEYHRFRSSEPPPDRERRPYDIQPDYLDDDGWTPKPLVDGAYPLDDDTRVRGVCHIDEVRAQLARQRWAARGRHPATVPPLDRILMSE